MGLNTEEQKLFYSGLDMTATQVVPMFFIADGLGSKHGASSDTMIYYNMVELKARDMNSPKGAEENRSCYSGPSQRCDF